MDASTSAVTIAAPDLLRRGLILWNDSTATCYVKFGSAASNTSFTWRLTTQSGYELPIPVYIGEITAVWESATGSMQVTELF